MGKKLPSSKRAPQQALISVQQIHAAIIAAADAAEPLKKILPVLASVVGSKTALALLFNEGDHSFRIAEQVGLSPKQRRGLQGFFPSLAEFATSDGSTRSGKSHGTAFVFSDVEARQRGCTSALVYYLVRAERLVCALVFCNERGQFDNAALKLLDSVSGLLAFVAENRFFREKVTETDGLVNLDGLTGLYNHRYFHEMLANELLKSQRFEHPVSVLLVDVDHFKKINDSYGHPQGDAVLKGISHILRKMTRAYDAPARYGGEEFAVVLPHADQGHAFHVAERVRKAVRSHTFPGRTPRETLKVTVSIGVASSPANAKTKAELIDRADQALYLAKSEGRNRVCLSLANSSEPIKVGFCPASLESAYYRDILSGMRDVVQEIKQIELTVRAPDQESDYAALPSIFREFIEDEPDAVAVCTQSPTAVEALKAFHNAKVPVFFFNVPEEINDKKIRSYVGYDQVEAGKTVALYLARLLRGRGHVAILEGLPEPTNRLRVRGFKQALAAFPEMRVIASERGDWITSQAKKVCRSLLQKHKDLDAIFAVSDAMAIGAGQAVKAQGKQGRIFVVGLDGTREALDAIMDGSLTATLDTSPREMGRILLRTIVRGLMREEKVAHQIHSPISIVTAENVEHALNP
jgi:diguanylate cyclase (GGDEF)-like protein